MVFSSLIFLYAFIPANLICYFAAKTVKTRNIIMLFFSLAFYAWGEPVYILILIGMSFFCWMFSILVERAPSKGMSRFALIAAAVVCIGAIGYFKYAGFLISNINSAVGFTLIEVPAVSLPIGISFYTFQLLTYVVDVYRGDVPAQKSFYKVLLYAGMYHQCVAGPIVRYGDIENELTERATDINDISRGVTRFICGLSKKALLANACGSVVDTLLLSDADIGNSALLSANLELLSGRSALTLWVGMAFYMMQIYLDFSAYSDMAIGLGLVTGFHYKENFNYPYVSASVSEFWRRWHISLGNFFRDYVYIPLGGNRKGKVRTIFNLFAVWFLTGLWHGASWNFVLWGLYFFVFIALEKLFLGKILEKIPAVFGRIYLLAVVYFGWIFFKFTDMQYVLVVFRGMFALNGNSWSSYEAVHFAENYVLFFVLAALACTPIIRYLADALHSLSPLYKAPRVIYNAVAFIAPVILLVLSTLALVGDSYNPFLYFQF